MIKELILPTYIKLIVLFPIENGAEIFPLSIPFEEHCQIHINDRHFSTIVIP